MKLVNREELVRQMERQGWSTRKLAAACGLKSNTMIQRLRTGDATTCSPALARAISENLDVRLGFLFETRISSRAGRRGQRSPQPAHPQVPAQRTKRTRVA
jgi:transcriptional regulator with XRE-family HTH domain